MTQYNLEELEAWLIESDHEMLMAFSALMLAFDDRGAVELFPWP